MTRTVARMVCLFCALSIGPAVAYAQGTTRQPPVSPGPEVRLNVPSRLLSSPGRLTKAKLKKAFIAQRLRVDPRSIVLSKPITLYPGRGDLHRPNRYSTQISGTIHMSTWQNTIDFSGRSTYWLYIEPAAFDKSITHYLVIATVFSL
jgi:hypothetical protein